VTTPHGTFTIGAGPVDGSLVADYNREVDKDPSLHPESRLHTLRRPARYTTDVEWVAALVAATEAYGDNLPYHRFPGLRGGEYYNSNSFISGLLGFTGTERPELATVFAEDDDLLHDYPGWRNPVPAQRFE